MVVFKSNSIFFDSHSFNCLRFRTVWKGKNKETNEFVALKQIKMKTENEEVKQGVRSHTYSLFLGFSVIILRSCYFP